MIENFKNVVLNNYANFEGRARRREYWLFYLANCIVSVALNIISLAIGGDLSTLNFVDVISLLYVLALLVPVIALTIRRLHDTDRSGWWLLIALVPIIGAIVLFVFMVLPGTEGENKYGPDPKANELM